MPEKEINIMKDNATRYIKENYDYEDVCQKYMALIYCACNKNE
jgi:hypothetical protein